MKQLDINKFDDFDGEEIARRILMEDPVMRVVLVSLRAGQSLPEHAANGLVTVYAVGGHVLFYEGAECCDMVSGTLIRLAPGLPHRVEAKEDSRLLVTMIKPSDASAWNALTPGAGLWICGRPLANDVTAPYSMLLILWGSASPSF